MTDKLPPNLLALFAPRPALRYLPPSDVAPELRKTTTVTGLGQYMDILKNEKDNDGYVPTESWLQRRDRVKLEKKERQEKLQTEGVKDYKPAEDPQIRGDPFRTLFVSRLSYDTEVKDLEREFGRYGPIERIRIVTNTHVDPNAPPKKKYRGYAFIVYEREKDMKAAYKETDGIRIKDRRVLVDVERGRTVSGWRPRRFGGGLGGRGYTKAAPARPNGFAGGPPTGPGGFRGGFGGGFRGGRGGGFRGGFGDRGGFRGGDRGGYGGGGRGGIGYQPNGFGAPEGAPSGPRGGRGGGFGAGPGRGGFGGPPNGPGGYGDDRGGRSYDDRNGYGRGPGASGSNREPVRPRDGGYRDRDRDGGYGGGRDDYSRKRQHEGDSGYEDPRRKRQY